MNSQQMLIAQIESKLVWYVTVSSLFTPILASRLQEVYVCYKLQH